MELTETEKEVDRIMNERRKKGRKEYGKGISFKQNDSSIKWITEAIEESADLLQYLVAMKMKMEEK